MKTFKVTVAQQFYCTYFIEAENQAHAWEALMNGDAVCTDQDPDEVIDGPDTAHWEEIV